MRKNLTSLILFAVLLSGCNFAMPAAPSTPEVPTAAVSAATRTPSRVPPTRTPSPPPASVTPTQEPAASATSVIFPLLTFASDAVCRAGPGVRYLARLRIEKGKSFEASGRNEDGSWIVVQAAHIGDDCWVQASALDNPGDLSDLRVLEAQPLPDQPLNFVASDNACGGINHLWLYWYNGNAVGYRIYRNGKEIATVYGSKYRDLNTPRSKEPEVYRYEIEAFNGSGVSERSGVSVTICG